MKHLENNSTRTEPTEKNMKMLEREWGMEAWQKEKLSTRSCTAEKLKDEIENLPGLWQLFS